MSDRNSSNSDMEPGHFVCAAELVDAETAPPEVTDQTHGPPMPSSSAVRGATQDPTRRRTSQRTRPANDDGDIAMRSSPSPSPLPVPHRSTTWAADGVAGISAPASARYAGTALDKPGSDTTSGSSSTTATPNVNPRNPYTAPTVPIQPHVPSLRTSQQRTAGDRSSGSSGDGDSGTVKPVNKRPKPMASRNLYGSLHVPAARVVAPEGDFGLWFLFTVSPALTEQSCILAGFSLFCARADQEGPHSARGRNVSCISAFFGSSSFAGHLISVTAGVTVRRRPLGGFSCQIYGGG